MIKLRTSCSSYCYPKTKTNMLVVDPRSSGNFQCLECGQHLALKSLVMIVKRMKVLRWTTALGPTDSGQYRFNHLLAQDQKRYERADTGPTHSIAPRFA